MSATPQRGVGILQASMKTWYGIIVGKGDEEPTFYSRELDEASRALCIFELPEKGESFVTFVGLRPEWRVLAYPARRLIPVIEWTTADGPGYVTINPPGRRHSLVEGVRTAPIEDFLESLR